MTITWKWFLLSLSHWPMARPRMQPWKFLPSSRALSSSSTRPDPVATWKIMMMPADIVEGDDDDDACQHCWGWWWWWWCLSTMLRVMMMMMLMMVMWILNKFTWPCTLSLASPLYVDNLVKESQFGKIISSLGSIHKICRHHHHYHCKDQSIF